MFNIEPSFNIPTTLFYVLFPIISIVLCAGLFFLLPSKSKKAVKVTKIVLAFSLIAIYLARTIFVVYRYVTLLGRFEFSYIDKMFGLDLNFYFIVMTSVYLLYSAFSSKNNFFMDLIKNTMISIAFPFALLILFNPKMIINISDDWYHFGNLTAMLINLVLLISPLYLVKSKDIDVNLKNFWQGIAGYILALCLCMTLNIIIKGANISELSSSYTLNRIIGTNIGFPWFLLIVIPIFLIISFAVYCLIRLIVALITHQSYLDAPVREKKNDFFDIYNFATKTVCCMQGILLLIILATLVKKPEGNILGIICLIPFVMTIFCLLAVKEMQKYVDNYDESLFEKGNKNAKRIITFAFIGNFIFGFALNNQFKNERESILENKRRLERKKLREQQAQEETEEN